MLYSKHITIPKSTTEANSKKLQFKVNQGFIFRVWITFPDGCNGLVNIRILHEDHPFLPVNKDAFITGNNHVFEYPMFFEIADEPQQITIEAWNDDDTFNHTLDIQILILPKAFILPVGAVEGIMESLSNLIIKKVEVE